MAIEAAKNISKQLAKTPITIQAVDFGRRYFWILLPAAIISTVLITRYIIKRNTPPSETKRLKTDLDTQKAELTKLKQELETSKGKNRPLENRITVLEAKLIDIDQLKQKLQTKTEELSRVTQEKALGEARLQQQVNGLREDLQTKTEELARVTQEKTVGEARLQQQVNGLRENLQTKTEELTRVAQEKAVEEARLLQEMNGLRENLQTKTEKLAQVTQEKTDREAHLQQEVERLKEELDTIDERLYQIALKKDDLIQNLDQIKQEKAAIEANQQQKVEKLKEELETKIQELAQVTQEKTDREAPLRKKVEELQKELETKTQALARVTQEKEALETNQQQAVKKLRENFQTEAQKLLLETKKQTDKEAALQKEVTGLRKDLQAKTEELERVPQAAVGEAALKKEVTRLSKMLQDKAQKLVQAKEKLLELQNEPKNQTTENRQQSEQKLAAAQAKVERLSIELQQSNEALELAKTEKKELHQQLAKQIEDLTNQVESLTLERNNERANFEEQMNQLRIANARFKALAARADFSEGASFAQHVGRFKDMLWKEYILHLADIRNKMKTLRKMSPERERNIENAKQDNENWIPQLAKDMQLEAIQIFNEVNPLDKAAKNLNVLTSQTKRITEDVDFTQATDEYQITLLMKAVSVQLQLIALIEMKTAPQCKNKERMEYRTEAHPIKQEKYQDAVDDYANELGIDRLQNLLNKQTKTDEFSLKLKKTLQLLLVKEDSVSDNRGRYQTLIGTLEKIVQHDQWNKEPIFKGEYRDVIEDLIFFMWHNHSQWEYLERLPEEFRKFSGDYENEASKTFKKDDFHKWVHQVNTVINYTPQSEFLRKKWEAKLKQMWEGNVGMNYILMNIPHLKYQLKCKKGDQEQVVNVARYPSPTTPGSNLVAVARLFGKKPLEAAAGKENASIFDGGNNEKVSPLYREFIKICAKKKEKIGVFLTSHQTLIPGSGEDESGRANELVNLEEDKDLPQNYFCLVQPFYGKFFDKTDEYASQTTFNELKKSIVNAFAESKGKETGCSLPAILRKPQKATGGMKKYREVMEKMCDDVHNIFFDGQKDIGLPKWMNGHETPFNGTNGLTSEDKKLIAWQSFLIYFYIFQQLDLTFRLEELQENEKRAIVYKILHRVSQCKDAQDRAGLLAFVQEGLINCMLAKNKDPKNPDGQPQETVDQKKQRADDFMSVPIANKKQGVNHWLDLALRADAICHYLPDDKIKALKACTFGGFKITDTERAKAKDYKEHTIHNAQYETEYKNWYHLLNDEKYHIYEKVGRWTGPLLWKSPVPKRNQKFHSLEKINLDKSDLKGQWKLSLNNRTLSNKKTLIEEAKKSDRQNGEKALQELIGAQAALQSQLIDCLKNDKVDIAFPENNRTIQFNPDKQKNHIVMELPFKISNKNKTNLCSGTAILRRKISEQKWSWSWKDSAPAA